MPQKTAFEIEHEALHRLPGLLAEMLDEPRLDLVRDRGAGRGADLVVADSQGRHWIVKVKASSRPGRIADAAHQLRRWVSELSPTGEAIPLLVVPYMSEAGAHAAEGAGVNWLDLSGNASLRAENLRVWVRGRPNAYPSLGRPSSPFAPRSARVTRVLLLEPSRWWRQKDLVETTALDDGTVSRVVRRLDEELLVERRGRELRPREPALLLDAWAEDYRFDRHDILAGHQSGSGIELAHDLANRLREVEVHHAFTGLPAAWAMDGFARFRLTTCYVDGNPREVADELGLRRSARGANVQLVGPNDPHVFAGERAWNGLTCVSPVQVYLDLLHLPERAAEAARHLRAERLWSRGAA